MGRLSQTICALFSVVVIINSAAAKHIEHELRNEKPPHAQTKHNDCHRHPCAARVELGPRPFYLVDKMESSPLKEKLQSCQNGPFYKTDFSIGHRGAALQFPEHTKESYTAAARMGAGIIECDVTFTKDRQLVCRHSQCDLAATTNIVATDLGAKCRKPFTPADPLTATPASASCCTSDITLAEFKTLCGKMDATNPMATTPEAFLGGTPQFRTDLYSSCATLLSHKESIELFKTLRVKFTPELKSPSVPMPFEGEYTQQQYAQQMLDEYRQAGVKPKDVWAQSFDLNDILYWLENNPAFGQQAVYLDDRVYSEPDFDSSLAHFEALKAHGVQIVAPPMFALLALDASNNIVPSQYAINAKLAGLDMITWTFERSGRLLEDMKKGTGGTFYYESILDAITNDGDMMVTLDVLAKEVGIIGMFSDWPASVTYYANCMNL